MRLSDRVYLTLSGNSGCSLSHPSDCNAYALNCDGEFLLIDAGVGIETERLLQNLELDGVALNTISALLLTHGHLDHSGGARWLHDALELEVIASVKTAARVEDGDEEAISLPAARRSGIYGHENRLNACPISRKLLPGETWTVGDVAITAFATPGHSEDMTSYLVQTPDELLAFTGDTVLHAGRIILQDTYDCCPADYARSLRQLAALPIDGLFPGHGIWSLKRGAKQVRASLTYLDQLLLPPNAF
jgi:hydroxyacylglutathione hydrolase